jgi:hypothetical protein
MAVNNVSEPPGLSYMDFPEPISLHVGSSLVFRGDALNRVGIRMSRRKISGVKTIWAAIVALYDDSIDKETGFHFRRVLKKIAFWAYKVSERVFLDQCKQAFQDARELWLEAKSLSWDVEEKAKRSFLLGWIVKPLKGDLYQHTLAQLSFVKRALPYPEPGSEVKQINQHKVDLGAFPCPTREDTLERARIFAFQWALRYLPHLEDVTPSMLNVSSSACVEYTRREGGQIRWWQEAISAFRLETQIPLHIGDVATPWEPLPEVIGGIGIQTALNEFDLYHIPIKDPSIRVGNEDYEAFKALHELDHKEEDPPDMGIKPLVRSFGRHVEVFNASFQGTFDARKAPDPQFPPIPWDVIPRPIGVVTTVPERGLKNRIVTKSPAGVVVLGHLARQRLIQGLKRTPETAGPLNGIPEDDLVNRLGRCTGAVLSSDLRAASDLLPHDLVRAIVEGLALSGRFTLVELWGLCLCTQSQILEYPDGEKFASTRGILMGLPTTWCLLSIIHLFWWKEAIRSSSLPRKAWASACICGDDLIAVAPPVVLDRYERLVQICGGELSPGKHMRSKSRGVFLEMLFGFTGPERSLVTSHSVRLGNATLFPEKRAMFVSRPTIDRELSLPLRSLFEDAPEESGSGRSSRPVSHLPEWVMAGEVTEGYTLLGFPKETVRRLVMCAYPSAHEQLRKANIPPFLPRMLGGGGLLPLQEDPKVSKLAGASYRKALAVLVTDTSLTSDPNCLARIWMLTKDRILSDSQTIADKQYLRVRAKSQRTGSQTDSQMAFDDLRTGLITRIDSWNRLLRDPKDPKVQRINLHRVQKTLSTRVRTLIEKWPSVKPVSNMRLSALVTRLNDLRKDIVDVVDRSRLNIPPEFEFDSEDRICRNAVESTKFLARISMLGEEINIQAYGPGD